MANPTINSTNGWHTSQITGLGDKRNRNISVKWRTQNKVCCEGSRHPVRLADERILPLGILDRYTIYERIYPKPKQCGHCRTWYHPAVFVDSKRI